jgi:hypothetical protein
MKHRICEIAEVTSGYPFREKIESQFGSTVSVLQIKDVVEDQGIQESGLATVQVRNAEPYLVSEGDVIFLSRGHRRFAKAIRAPLRNTIATGYFFILRPDPSQILSGFLSWTINQEQFQETLRPLIRGSNVPFVSKSDFQEIKIEVPSFEVQTRILGLQSLCVREKQITERLNLKRQQLIDAISRKLIHEQPSS